MSDALPPPYRSRHSQTTFFGSALHAWHGLMHTVLHQRNMRMHVIAALLVGLVASGVPLGLDEKVTLLFCVMLVFFAEMLNSALEQLVDLATQEFDEKAKLTKDIAAAGVLVLAIGTVVIFAAILVHDASAIFANASAIERQVLYGTPLALCAGALMRDAPKPWAVDVLLAFGALVLWANTVRWTESEVFSAMNLGLLAICINAAWLRRLARRQVEPRH
jgi:diacylglycerol kinase (ATP)